MFNKIYLKKERTKAKFKIHDLVRTADLKTCPQKAIQQIGLTNYIKIQNLERIQYRAIALIIQKSVIMKPY